MPIQTQDFLSVPFLNQTILKSSTWDYICNMIMLYGIRVLGALAIVLIGHFVVNKCSQWVEKLLKRSKFEATLTGFFVNVMYFGLMAFIIIAALGHLGIETTSLAAVIGAAGLAIGLALQGTLSNIAAGILLVVFRPLKVGDYVETAGTGGVVKHIALFTTVLTTPDNKVVTVPNAKITSDNIINYNTLGKRRLDLIISVAYSSDLQKVKQILNDIVNNDSRILSDPAPVIGVLDLAESAVQLAVRPWCLVEDFFDVRLYLNEQIKTRFDAEGISIPFPQREVHVTQKSGDAMPPLFGLG